VSLRRDVHSAFDVITPSMAGLSERVVQTVLVEGATRRRKEKMLFRIRAPLSLVAVFLLIALVAAVFIGGRLIQDWNALHNSPAGQSTQSELAQLEARHLNLPVLKSRSECTTGPFNSDGTVGSGPLFAYAYGGLGGKTSWGAYIDNDFYADRQISGPILVRVRDVLNNVTGVFVGNFAAGPVVGTDVLNGTRVEQHSELVLFENTAARVTDNPPSRPHAFKWGFTAGVPNESSGSTGWQIDGLGFTEVFLVC
jgi:hypothetical protein